MSNAKQAVDPPQKDENVKEPSLGPACGFFFLFACAAISISLIVISWWMGGRQNIQASSAIQTQLIPWIEGSSLADADRQSIIERLHELIADMEAERLSGRQLSRLNFRLSGAPIFQWGVIEALERRALASTELSEIEKQAMSSACNRLLRTALDGRIAMEQLEFAVQQVATKERKSGRLTIRDEVSTVDLREFLRRITSVSDRVKTSSEPLEQSVSQVFRAMVEDALSEK